MIEKIKKYKKYQNYFRSIIIVICCSIIYFNVKNENVIVETLQNLNLIKFIGPFVIALIIMMLWSNLIFNTFKESVNLKIKYSTWTKIFFNSQFYNFIPFAGFLYRGFILKEYNISYKNYLFNYLFINWIYSITAFLVFGLEIAIFVDIKLSFFIIPIIILFPALSLLIFIGPIVFNFFYKKFFIENILLKFLNDLSYFLINNINKKKLKRNFFISFALIHIFDFFLYFSVVNFLNIPISIKTIFLIWLINTIIDLFPITPQNIAVSELLSALIGTFLGINFTSGMLVRVFVRASWVCSAIFYFIFSNFFLKFEKHSNLN